ncbi:MAG: helix-turn-helix transcriptional regulator [Solobacterium sp.]|nr:helix-turn-helix transcriptional regulator [Solobacterium sp.]
MPMIDMLATGARITNLRKEHGITVAMIMDKLGVTKTAVYKWQRGEALPTLDNLVILADMMNVTLNDIVVVTTR